MFHLLKVLFFPFQKKTPLCSKKQQKGGALLQVLIMSSFMSFVFYAMMQALVTQKGQHELTKKATGAHIVMGSLMEYLHTALQNKWCIHSRIMTPESNCTLRHPRSMERVMMNSETHNTIHKMLRHGIPVGGLSSPSELRPLNCLQGKIDLRSLPSDHSLKQVAHSYEKHNVKFEKAIYRVKRAPNGSSFGGSNQTLLDMRILLTSEEKGEKKLQAIHSLVGIMPRELGTFALIVPNNLRLDRSFSYIEQGDANIHTYPSRRAFRGKGLVFESPVFVHRNIYLPKHSPATQPPYSPVTFLDKVILGKGHIMQGRAVYKPKISNTFAPVWIDTPYFGGFLNGLKIDGEEDMGLDYFSGKQSTALAQLQLSHQNMKNCIEHSLVEIDYLQTLESQLKMDPLSSGQYRFQLTKFNRVLPQEVGNEKEVQGPANPKYQTVGFTEYGDSTKKIVRLQLKWGNNIVKANVPEGGTLKGGFKLKPSYLEELNTNIQTKESTLNNLDLSLASLLSQKRGLASNDPSISTLTAQINALNATRNQLTIEIQRLKEKKQPALIKLTVSPQPFGGGDKDMASFRLKVDFENKPRFESYLVEDLGLSGFNLSVEPFDVAYRGGVNERLDHKGGYDRKGELQYTLNGTSSFRYPSSQNDFHSHHPVSWNKHEFMKTKCQGDTYYGEAFGSNLGWEGVLLPIPVLLGLLRKVSMTRFLP